MQKFLHDIVVTIIANPEFKADMSDHNVVQFTTGERYVGDRSIRAPGR
jgi:hypothetical protein